MKILGNISGVVCIKFILLKAWLTIIETEKKKHKDEMLLEICGIGAIKNKFFLFQ